MEAFVEVANLEKTYSGGLFGKPMTALHGISFKIAGGELMGLLGPNGAGKTTTVKVLSGLVTATGGTARIFGRDASEPESRRLLGYLPERASPPDWLNGHECLDREGRIFGLPRAERRKTAERLIARVGLEPAVAARRVATYSKGERARLGLACALIADAKVLLLDEPTDGLDPVGRREVRDLLVELKKEGRAVLLNSHLLSEVETCCDHVAILAHGRIAAQGKTDELLAQGRVRYTIRTLPTPSPEDLAAIGAVVKDVTKETDGLVVDLAQESDVDRLVDALRGRGLSIRELTPRRASLEQFFLQAIQTAPPGSVAP